MEYYRRYTKMGRRAYIAFDHGDKGRDLDRRVLLLRHPCDVMVSFWLHKKVRRKVPKTIDHFVRHPFFGIPAYNESYTTWSEREEGQMVVCYEDLFDEEPWREMLAFWDIPLHEEAFAQARAKTQFDTIRKNLDEIATFPSAWRYLAAEHGRYNLIEPKNPEAHKFRRGVVSGYVDYLEKEDIDYILGNFTLGERLEPYRQRYLAMSEMLHG